MKIKDFLTEHTNIGQDANNMHKDHEVQMARQDCYNAAKDAIALHKLLKQIDEMQGLDGWVSEKLTLAADYLKTVHDYLEYEMLAQKESMLPAFEMESAEQIFDQAISKGAEHADSDEYHDSPSMQGVNEVKAKEIMPNGDGNGATDDPRIKLQRIKNKIKEYEDLIKQHSDGITARVADIIAKRDRLVKQKEKLEKMGVKEDASAGASSAGAVATVSKPLMKKPIKRKMK
jgi:hypothetical protein